MVDIYVKTKDMSEVDKVQHDVVALYKEDFMIKCKVYSSNWVKSVNLSSIPYTFVNAEVGLHIPFGLKRFS